MLPTLAAIAIGAQIGAQITLTRALAGSVPPVSLALGRYLVALALLAPLALRTQVRLRRADLLPIGVLGALNFGLMIALQNAALHHMPAARGALVFATLPLFVMLIAIALRQERATVAKTAGVLLTGCGVALALGERALAGAGAPGGGDVLMLAASLLAAACAVLYRPYVTRYPAVAVAAVAILCADLALLAGAWAEGFPGTLLSLPAAGWLGVVVLGASSAGFYWLWLWTIRRLPPTRANLFQSLGPVTAAATAALFLDEPVSSHFLAGLGLLVGGFVLAYRPEGRVVPDRLAEAGPAGQGGRDDNEHRRTDAHVRPDPRPLTLGPHRSAGGWQPADGGEASVGARIDPPRHGVRHQP